MRDLFAKQLGLRRLVGGGSVSETSETRLEENGTTTRIQEDGATRVTEGT